MDCVPPGLFRGSSRFAATGERMPMMVTDRVPVLVALKYAAATSLPDGADPCIRNGDARCPRVSRRSHAANSRTGTQRGVSCGHPLRTGSRDVAGGNYARRPAREAMMPALPMNATPRTSRSEVSALVALFAGALAIGSSGIFVRLSETGPTATAFWRGAIALPFLFVWVVLERGRGAQAGQTSASVRDPLFLWAGAFFAGDLALWHWSLLLTSIAASTLEANCAPLLVTVFAWMLLGERPRLGFVLSLGLAFAGMLLILAPKLGGGSHGLVGDALGLGTACFYAAYIMVVARLRAP